MGTSAAYLYSTAVTFFPGAFERAAGAGFKAAVYYDSAVLIIGLILLGRYLEARAKGETSAAMRKLIGLRAKTARVLRVPAAAGVPAPVRGAVAACALEERVVDKVVFFYAPRIIGGRGAVSAQLMRHDRVVIDAVAR